MNKEETPHDPMTDQNISDEPLPLTALPPVTLASGITVLLVDDQPEEVRLLGEMLRRAGARVLLATDGLDALRLARDIRPNVILLDVNLPPLDGFEVCRQLQELSGTRAIPVLFLTGRIEVENRLLGFSAGGRDYITKPFLEAEVLARVNLHADLTRRHMHEPRAGHLKGDAPPWLTQAVDILQDQLSITPRLTVLAYKVGTNPRQLNEAFRTHLGNTVFGYLRECRLKEAHRLLMDSSLTIQQISDRMGYSNGANFSTAFRERFGVSPSQLRRDLDEE